MSKIAVSSGTAQNVANQWQTRKFNRNVCPMTESKVELPVHSKTFRTPAWLAAVAAALAATALAAAATCGVARADETVSIAGSNAVLLRPKAPRGSIILMPGSDGRISAGANGEIKALAGNQLVRTRHSYMARGFAVLVADAGTDLVAAVNYMAAIKRPVTVAATSRGTLRAAEGIARGARPDRLVLTSGFLTVESGSGQNVASILGSPAALPPTLVIHHRHDGCRFTQPYGVEPFVRWAGGRVRVAWLDGGVDTGDPCEARSHHGFNGLDGQVVGFVTRR
jgi:hypothetical protein